jgi:signal transduction histidine kinase/CheY-like chemotaxis protein
LDAQNLVDNADGKGKSLTYEGFKAKGSHDKSLTAFAQLATFRLDVRRCMISLIDSKVQYILAEGTKTLSLLTQDAEKKEDEVWLGHSAIARQDAVCHHCFTSTYTTLEEDGEEFMAEALVIPDCREDPRFATRDYVVAEPGVRFYAGVPITTKNGHRIGVYAVSDEKPRPGLKAADVRFLQDVAAAVMEHLELAQARDARNTGERMVRGLTEFIGRSSLQDINNSSGPRSTTLEKQTENARLQAIADEEPVGAMPTAAKQPQRKRDPEGDTDTSRIFQRAARIIRQSTRADGVVFFDTSAAHVGNAYEEPSPTASSDENSYSSATAGSATASRKHSLRRAKSTKNAGIDTAGSEGVHDPIPSKPCPVAGLSRRTEPAGAIEGDFVFTEANMERYINRYPQGKFFNFDAEGAGINSSDERSGISEPEHVDKAAQIATATRRLRKGKDRFIPTEFLKILPTVRSLIFLPLWDPASERWAAGGFIWTTSTGKLLNPDNELPYLKAFGNSITSEIARWNAQKSDRAKTTFIASISHELRSPLHGILGSVEFLRDAVSSVYQQSLVSSIETCGKTLLDTIDHVLDYAKINKLRSASVRRKQRGERNRRVSADNSILGVTTVFNLAELVEEVCETVCAGHNFRKTHDVHTTFHDQGSRAANSTAGNEQGKAGGAMGSDRVVVTLNVAPLVPWIVRSQPGALRRVVMNLLGNALKYTQTGFITVSLMQNVQRSNSHAVEFDISVEDSGRGMSTEYQHTKLFAPFSQEDPFSNGTGLGLSIVKQIVESLKGQVDVQSAVNVGTKISASLRLPAGSLDQARTIPYLIEPSLELKDKVACIVFPPTTLGRIGEKLSESTAMLCRGLRVKTYENLDLTTTSPDFLVTEPDSLLAQLSKQEKVDAKRTQLAVICVCSDPSEKTATEASIYKHHPVHPWSIEVVTQPVGPRKLAQLLLDGQAQAAQKVQRPLKPTKPPHLTMEGTHDPKLTVHRSISGLVHGANAVPSSISASHSPLISATMPSTAVSPFPTAFSQTPSTLSGSSQTEYFSPRVLLVDDNAINLKLLVVFAQRQSLHYFEATNGLEALNIYKDRALSTDPPTKPFDFILMDLSMPIMGGLESTRLIRGFESEKELQRSTIVALTGLASAQDQQDASDAGVDEYLVKPVKFADIKRVFGTK